MMKRFFVAVLLFCFCGVNFGVLAEEISAEYVTPSVQSDTSIAKVHDDAPVWEEYVAPKYREPRGDFGKGASISELVVGIVLTELILTAPIGIPMTVHGTTKVKMVSYNNRKQIFDEEIAKAKLIENDEERAEAYKKVLKRCHLKESTRQHYARKEGKSKKKSEKTKV